MRAEQADLIEFGTDSRRIQFVPGESVLRVLDRFHSLGGTNTAAAVTRHYSEHDRVVVVTDEQAQWEPDHDPLSAVPEHIPVDHGSLNGQATALARTLVLMHEPKQRIGALHTESTITVYQAYAPRIGLPAARDGRFPAAWKRDRMTRIKPRS